MPAPLRTVASNSGCDAMGIRYIGPGELEDVPGAMLALTGARPVLRCGNRRKASDVRTGAPARVYANAIPGQTLLIIRIRGSGFGAGPRWLAGQRAAGQRAAVLLAQLQRWLRSFLH